ncbi:MAG: UDP-N-acetylglucosamine 2-epimerase (non-hydrolyzing) [Myxococcota bacterium]
MPDAPIRLLTVAGARPNFMKIAPILAECERRGSDCIEATLVHTGQHYDEQMSATFFADLGIPLPDFNLGVGSGSHGRQTAEVLTRIEEILEAAPPDAVLVVGDVNSTLAASLAAVKLEIPVAHVEAGLRSFDRRMPEEINRILTDSISDWLFTTEEAAEANLLREGVAPERIHFVGNVMIDTLRANLERAHQQDTLERLGLEAGGYAVLTLHRPSNVDDAAHLTALFAVLEEIHVTLPVVFPVHPRTRASIEAGLGGKLPDLHTTLPLGYLDFLELMSKARVVLTDSGGIQEETTALGVDCLTLRDSTERPITIEQGTNRLVGTDPEALRSAFREIGTHPRETPSVPKGWDGRAAERILDILLHDLKGAR